MSLPPNLAANAPWKQRFRTTAVYNGQVADDGKRGLVASNANGSAFQLYAWDVVSGELRQLTDAPEGMAEGWLTPHGQDVYYLQDKQGNELGHLQRLPYDPDGEPEDLTPDLPPYTLRGFGFSGAGNRMAFKAVNGDGFQLYVADLGAGGRPHAPRLVNRSEKEAWDALLSYDGALVAEKSTERAGGKRQYSLRVFDANDGTLVGELWDGPGTSVEGAAFAPVAGDPRVLATTTRTGFRRPLIWNPRTGERTDIDLPELGGEVMACDWSADGRLLLCQIDRAQQQLYVYALDDGTLTKVQHPSGTWYGTFGPSPFWGPDGQIWDMWENSVTPPRLVALDPHGDGQPRVLLSSDELPPGRPWRSVTFTSSDGQEIQGWLATPDGEGPFPTILETHGGPHHATMDFCDPASQTWLDHGYAFLSINQRGSTTFGRDFMEKIWGDLGHWELEDMVAARDWLVREGIAQPDAIILEGGSYGGYLTLFGLGKRPDLWAGGIAIVPIADHVTDYEDVSEALRAAVAGWFNGTLEEKREQYIASSPITYAADVRAPVLIFQGLHDTRCTPRQMHLYEAKMREYGKDIEVVWFEAGHGSLSNDLIISFQEKMLEFAYRVTNESVKA